MGSYITKMKPQMKIQKNVLIYISVSKIQRMNYNENHFIYKCLCQPSIYGLGSMKDTHASTLER